MQRLVKNFGPFDQGVGADGAHYVEQSPFGKEGIICANCAFYEGPRGCEIVSGDIAPEAICKLWVIPVDLMEKPKGKASGGRQNAESLTSINYEEEKDSGKSATKNENILPDRDAAEALAVKLGCEGAHEVEGGWAACPSPAALVASLRDGKNGFAAWKKQQGAGDGERERGVAGIETMPEGGLVSQKSLLNLAEQIDYFYDRVDRKINLLDQQDQDY
jgi:hypothetical protein